jgi:Icc protein
MNRRDFAQHVAWTGAGIAYTLTSAGLLGSRAVAQVEPATAIDFVQISDSHIGFHQAANPDVAGTLGAAVDAINLLEKQPAFVVHTGDVTHLSTPQQFETAKGILGRLRAPLVVLPGEHDFIGTDHKRFFEVFPADDKRSTWRSWDRQGVHYVVLINVFDFEKMGLIGSDQLQWLERDLAGQKSTTPIVVFTHVPLYALYPQWGWTTEDGSKALAMLQRFENVAVLNGHIHQVVRHREGRITFASAAATAYPQPAPGTADKPGPVTLPHDSLLHAIGYREVELLDDGRAVIDERTLA